MRCLSLIGLVLLAACGEPYHAPDSGCGLACRDSSIRDAGSFIDAYTSRLPLTQPLGECLPADEAECGCIDGFRRCDTCGWCPTGFACDDYAGVCRGLDYNDYYGPSGQTWGDTCDFPVLYSVLGPVNPYSVYCHTGKVCGPSIEADGDFGRHAFTGRCFPVSFCQAASVADPPVSTLRCVYSDGSDVANGPPDRGDCPVGDLREPYCGGVCGDSLRCPLYPEVLFFAHEIRPGPPQSCVAFSETRSFGVCAWGDTRCTQGNPEGNQFDLDSCNTGYGEPCACLVTHPQLHESRSVLGYVVLASVCRDYQLHFPSSTECVDAEWNPLPPP